MALTQVCEVTGSDPGSRPADSEASDGSVLCAAAASLVAGLGFQDAAC